MSIAYAFLAEGSHQIGAYLENKAIQASSERCLSDQGAIGGRRRGNWASFVFLNQYRRHGSGQKRNKGACGT